MWAHYLSPVTHASGAQGLMKRSLAAVASDVPERRLKEDVTSHGNSQQRGKTLTGALRDTLSVVRAQPLLAWRTLSLQPGTKSEPVSLDADVATATDADVAAAASSFWLSLEAEEGRQVGADEQVASTSASSGEGRWWKLRRRNKQILAEGNRLPPSPMDEGSARLSVGQNLVQKHRDSVASSGRRYSPKQFLNGRGQRIFTHQWLPPDEQQLRATVVLLHGLNEHSGRYEHFARRLNAHGFALIGMDWIGHGMSDGLHGFVDRLDHVVDDARQLVERVQRDNLGVPCFMFGHSMGASIILKTVAQEEGVGDRLAGLVLTAPAVRLGLPPPAVLKAVAPIISALHPTLPLSRVGKRRVNVVSRDLRVCADKYSDPLVYTGALRARMGHEILRLVSDLDHHIPKVQTPFLVLHGTGDVVTKCEGSVHLHAAAPAQHKDLRLYEGLFHDLLMEPEKDQVADDILSWMDARLTDKQ